MCIYLAADTTDALLGLELVDKGNNIVFSSTESLSEINIIGVVRFSIGEPLRQENLAYMRFFGRNLNICAKVVECSVASRWPLRPSKLVPYACFSNDE